MPEEFKNQFSHCLFAMIASTVFYIFCPFMWGAVIISAIMGLSVEVWQYFYNDNRELKIKDRALDFSFYIVGALYFILLVKVF